MSNNILAMPEAAEFSDLFKYATLEELPPIMWGHRRNVKFGRICEVNIAGCARSMYVSPNDALLETLKRNVFAIDDETYFRIVNENKISGRRSVKTNKAYVVCSYRKMIKHVRLARIDISSVPHPKIGE